MDRAREGTIPEAIVVAIEEDLTTRNLEVQSIGPGEPMLTRADEHEQYYLVTSMTPDGGEVRALYFAANTANGWDVGYVRAIER